MTDQRGFWEGIPLDALRGGNIIDAPRFSPNGKYLAYILTAFGQSNLHYYDIAQQTHYQLTDGVKLSTGTPYNGKTYDWLRDSSGIIFSSEGQLFSIAINGGPPEEIQSINKSFSPTSNDHNLAFVIEHENHMSLAISRLHEGSIKWPARLDIDADFIYDPIFHPTDPILAVHIWDFPNMSWDGSEVVLYDLDRDLLTHVAGSNNIEASQPRFSPDGRYLSFICEETGWRNIWLSDSDGSNPRILVDEPIDHSYSIWVTGQSYYGWVDGQRIIFTRLNKGFYTLAVANVDTGEIMEVPLPEGEYSNITTDGKGTVALVYQNYKTVSQFMFFNMDDILQQGNPHVLIQGGMKLDRWEDKFVAPQLIECMSRDGNSVFGLYYCKEEVSNPPLLMLVHGGPTGMSRANFVRNAQYFASRGWAVFDINYRGSVGHGKQYREKLLGNWGIVDTDDCIDALKELGDRGLANPNKAVIMGGSAGGFAVLSALSRYPGVFKAGVDLFGVSELFLLTEETHYLESRYTDSIVGSLPETAEKYRDQSPLYHAEKITDPLLILQGKEDPVVPLNQSELIRDRVNGPVELKIYEGEGHGFKKKSTIDDMYPRVERFLRKYVLYT